MVLKEKIIVVFFMILCSSCVNKKKAAIGYGEVGLLVNGDGEIYDSMLFTEGTYHIESQHNLIIFDTRETIDAFVGHFSTSDGNIYKGHYTAGVKPDTAHLFMLYNDYGTNYHEFIFVPEVNRVVREHMSTVSQDSVGILNNPEFKSEIIKSASGILKEKGLILTLLRIDSIELTNSATKFN